MNNRKKYLCALFTVLMSMSLIVAFSFAKAAGRENYKTLSYKTLPSEEEIIALSAYDRRRMEYRDGRILCDCAEERR